MQRTRGLVQMVYKENEDMLSSVRTARNSERQQCGDVGADEEPAKMLSLESVPDWSGFSTVAWLFTRISFLTMKSVEFCISWDWHRCLWVWVNEFYPPGFGFSPQLTSFLTAKHSSVYRNTQSYNDQATYWQHVQPLFYRNARCLYACLPAASSEERLHSQGC